MFPLTVAGIFRFFTTLYFYGLATNYTIKRISILRLNNQWLTMMVALNWNIAKQKYKSEGTTQLTVSLLRLLKRKGDPQQLNSN